MPTNTSYTIANDLLTEMLDDELIVLDLRCGAYYGLSEVATRFWSLLQAGKSKAQANDLLLAEYEVTPAELTRDIDSLLDDLTKHGLVLPSTL